MRAILLRRRKLGRGSCHGIRRSSTRHQYTVARNDVRNRRGYPDAEAIIRWGCTDRIPDGRYRMVIQPAEAIQRVNNKSAFRRTLQEQHPDIVPRTWFNSADQDIEFPCIVRPRVHAQGRRLWVCQNRHDLNQAVARAGEGYYISKLINKVAEYRVFCVQGRIACIARKTPGDPNQVAWNVAQGGRFDHVRWGDWAISMARRALDAFNVSGLDFGGVDVMVDGEGQAYIIEINSAPSLPLKEDGTPTHRQECMSKCMDYMLDHGKDRIPLVERRGGWKKFVHPAISDEAELV